MKRVYECVVPARAAAVTKGEMRVKPLSAYSTAKVLVAVVAVGVVTLLLLRGQGAGGAAGDELWRHRNLGKAFFENPTTQLQAVDSFKKALDLAPGSSRERLNYGLALLRAGKMIEGVAELEKVQQQYPALPHTWFNLGIVFKKGAQYERAIHQFQKMVELVPDEPVSHYNLGVLYKLTGKSEQVLKEFETASRLDPNLAGPHFQLANTYRSLRRTEEADRELKVFQEIKKRQVGTAVPEDLEWSRYAEIYDVVEPHTSVGAAAPGAELKFKDQELAADPGTPAAGLVVLDAEADGIPDLLTWSANQVRLYKRGSEPLEGFGLSDVENVISVAPGDFNNDGLADLCVITGSGATLYANSKGKFRKQTELPAGRYEKGVWIDFDHDGDVDLFLLGEKPALIRNRGAAGFGDESTAFPFVPGRAVDGTVYDLIKDTSVSDLAVVYQDRPAVLYKDKLAGKFEAMPLEALAAGAKSVLAHDVDNDGWTDLVATSDSGIAILRNKQGTLESVTGPMSTKGPILFADLENRGISDLIAGVSVYQNQGLSRFGSGMPLAGLSSVVASAAMDLDGDGRVDLAVVSGNGAIHILRNETATGNQWLGVGLLGVRNLQLAPGAEVEVKAGASYQKRIYHGIPLLFGLQSYQEADTVRITWPNLLIQNEIKQAAGKIVSYKEKQRLSGSCPMVFAWNGTKFEFITDILGAAPLGVSGGEGRTLPVDHEEYIQIPAESLAPVKNHYEIRITEELHEVAYIDKVQLIAVDHPAGMDVFTSDKFQSPPFPGFRIFGVRQRAYPRSVRDHKGQDVLGRIVKRDRSYVDTFQRDYAGVAELHNLDLDFGSGVAAGNRALLVLNGWFDWADGSTFLRASQEGQGGLILPYLQVKDAQGRWRTVIEDMGIPAGKPKTIVVDLSGKFLSLSREIRIVTNLCVYWDEIFLSEETGKPPVTLFPLDAVSTELYFGGFSTPVVHPQRLQPEWFDYSRRASVSMWNPTPGRYTRYGDVQELLRTVDDRFVIMGSGDELRFSFKASRLPPLKGGYQRDFLLFVDGWTKDGDLNTALSQTVEPLPFHGMSQYPPPGGEIFPDDSPRRDYLKRYNTRPALRLLRPLDEDIRH